MPTSEVGRYLRFSFSMKTETKDVQAQSVSDGLAEVLDVFGSGNPLHTSKRLTNRNGSRNQDGVRLGCCVLITAKLAFSIYE